MRLFPIYWSLQLLHMCERRTNGNDYHHHHHHRYHHHHHYQHQHQRISIYVCTFHLKIHITNYTNYPSLQSILRLYKEEQNGSSTQVVVRWRRGRGAQLPLKRSTIVLPLTTWPYHHLKRSSLSHDDGWQHVVHQLISR